MKIESGDIHIWSTELTLTPDQAKDKLALLSQDEADRAARFRFGIHRNRFIASRSFLREVIASYVQADQKDILFGYTDYKKPFVQSPHPTALQFNLSHSHDIAVLACTLDHAIGIDIEKEQASFKQNIAERFFSAQENSELAKMDEEHKVSAFYRLWARKEALIKAVGKGLSIPLTQFSVAANDIEETITLENTVWHLIPLTIRPGYQSAVASNQTVKKISYWSMTEQSPQQSMCYTVGSATK